MKYIFDCVIILLSLMGGCYTVDLGPSDGYNFGRCQRYCAGVFMAHGLYTKCSLDKGCYCKCGN